MSTSTVYIPTHIKRGGKTFVFKTQLFFVGNKFAAGEKIKQLRKEFPDKVLRLNGGIISEYI